MPWPTHARRAAYSAKPAAAAYNPRDEPNARPGEGPVLTRDALRAARLFALFLFGVIAFNYPLLEVFSARRTLFGMPLLYCWIFGAWLALIAVLARLGRKG